MLCVGVNFAKGTSKRTGQPYEAYVIQALVRRQQQVSGLSTDQVWISPAEYQKNPIKPGDQFRAFQDGGIMILPAEDHINLEDIITNVL